MGLLSRQAKAKAETRDNAEEKDVEAAPGSSAPVPAQRSRPARLANKIVCCACDYWSEMPRAEQNRAIVAVLNGALLAGWLIGVSVMLAIASEGQEVPGTTEGVLARGRELQYRKMLQASSGRESTSVTLIVMSIMGNLFGPLFIFYGYQIPHLTIVANALQSAGLASFMESIMNMDTLNREAANGRVMPQQVLDLLRVVIFAFSITVAEMKILSFDTFMKGAVIGNALAERLVNSIPRAPGDRCACDVAGAVQACSPSVESGLYKTEPSCYEDRWMRFLIHGSLLTMAACWGTIQKRRVLLLYPAMLGANMLCAGIFDAVVVTKPEYGDRLQPFWFVGLILISGVSLHFHYWMRNFDLRAAGHETDQLFESELQLFPILRPCLALLHWAGRYTMWPLRKLDGLCREIEGLGRSTQHVKLQEVTEMTDDSHLNGDDIDNGSDSGKEQEQEQEQERKPVDGSATASARSSVVELQHAATQSQASTVSLCGRRRRKDTDDVDNESNEGGIPTPLAVSTPHLSKRDAKNAKLVKVAQQRVHLEILRCQGAKKAAIDATRFIHATSSVFSIAMLASASVAVHHSLWGSVVKRLAFDLGIALSVLLVLVAIPGTLGVQKQARVSALKAIAIAAMCFVVVSIAVLWISVDYVALLNGFRPDSRAGLLDNSTRDTLDARDLSGGDGMRWALRPIQQLHTGDNCTYDTGRDVFDLSCTKSRRLQDFARHKCLYMNVTDIYTLEQLSLQAYSQGDMNKHESLIAQRSLAQKVEFSTRTCFEANRIDAAVVHSGNGELGDRAPAATYCICRLAIAQSIYSYVQPFSMFAMGNLLFVALLTGAYIYIYLQALLSRDLEEEQAVLLSLTADATGPEKALNSQDSARRLVV